MTTPTTSSEKLAGPLASDAATAERPAGPCRLCRRGIFRGERYAVLPSGPFAHVPCIASAAGTTSRRVA